MSRRNQNHNQKVARRERNKARSEALLAKIQARPMRDIPTRITSLSFEARGGTRLDLVLLPGAVPFDPKGEPPVADLQAREREALNNLFSEPEGDA
jgi:hypothetical protein